jgi:hypothetical protein
MENVARKTDGKLPTHPLLSAGAGEGNRTLVCSLGSCRSTIELHPHRANMFVMGPPQSRPVVADGGGSRPGRHIRARSMAEQQ